MNNFYKDTDGNFCKPIYKYSQQALMQTQFQKMTKYEQLDELAIKYGTDKSSLGHKYTQAYAKHLPDKCRTFLEIGVAEAKSAHVWDEFYGKDELELSLVDLFINPEFVSQRYCWNRGWRTYKGDQSDYKFLYTIKDQFEVIVDDGSHDSIHQIISFQHLFINNLKSGGLWVTEDLHCCTMPEYRIRGDVKFEDTLLSVFKKYIETGEFTSAYFDDKAFGGESINNIFKANVESIDLYEDKIAFVRKRNVC
jgi:hypothetical protein